MMPMELSAIALQGLEQSQGAFEKSVVQLTAGSASTGNQPPSDVVDLSEAAVSMLSAKNGFDVNIRVLQIADQMQQQALDILA